MRNLALILLAVVLLYGCVESRCVDGKVYYRQPHGVWTRNIDSPECVNLPEKPE